MNILKRTAEREDEHQSIYGKAYIHVPRKPFNLPWKRFLNRRNDGRQRADTKCIQASPRKILGAFDAVHLKICLRNFAHLTNACNPRDDQNYAQNKREYILHVTGICGHAQKDNERQNANRTQMNRFKQRCNQICRYQQRRKKCNKL